MTESTINEAELIGLLVDAWTTALDIEVTAESDFFALGGTSVAAVAIARAVVARFGDCEGVEQFALQAVFEQPTLRDMAGALAAFVADAEREPAG